MPDEEDNECMRLRAARAEELAELNALILRSKAVWGYDDDFMAACKAELSVTMNDLDDTFVQVAENTAGPAGVAQTAILGDICVLHKLFVDPGAQAVGVGRMLYGWAVETCRAGGAKIMTIDADPGAAPFYRRMGARDDGETPSGSIPGRMLPRLICDLTLNQPAGES